MAVQYGGGDMVELLPAEVNFLRIAALYGSAVVSGTIASMVIVTSIVGAFAAKYSGRIQKIILRSKPARPGRPEIHGETGRD